MPSFILTKLFMLFLSEKPFSNKTALLCPLRKKDQNIDDYNSFSRFTIDLKNQKVSKDKITDAFVELETINYKKYNEKEYQFTYGPYQ